MNKNKKQLSEVIDGLRLYKIDDYYDPVRVISVINKVNKTKFTDQDLSVLNKDDGSIEIRANNNLKEYTGAVTIYFELDRHFKHIFLASLFALLFVLTLTILPSIGFINDVPILIWIGCGLCGLWLIGIVTCLITWPRSNKNKKLA